MSSDFGKDEDSVQSLAKKLECVERDLSQFQHTIGKLAKLSQGLVDRGHFDSHNITMKQVGCLYVQWQIVPELEDARLLVLQHWVNIHWRFAGNTWQTAGSEAKPMSD